MILVPIASMVFQREMTASSIHSLRLLASVLMSIALILVALPARAVPLIRDPDIEYALSRVAKPVLTAAGFGLALALAVAAERNKEALVVLEKARTRDFRDARMLRDLGQAYAKTGKKGQASLATAERYALQGRLKDAEVHAKRASGLLPRGSSAWRRAQDILVTAERADPKRK